MAELNPRRFYAYPGKTGWPHSQPVPPVHGEGRAWCLTCRRCGTVHIGIAQNRLHDVAIKHLEMWCPKDPSVVSSLTRPFGTERSTDTDGDAHVTSAVELPSPRTTEPSNETLSGSHQPTEPSTSTRSTDADVSPVEQLLQMLERPARHARTKRGFHRAPTGN